MTNTCMLSKRYLNYGTLVTWVVEFEDLNSFVPWTNSTLKERLGVTIVNPRQIGQF